MQMLTNFCRKSSLFFSYQYTVIEGTSLRPAMNREERFLSLVLIVKIYHELSEFV